MRIATPGGATTLPTATPSMIVPFFEPRSLIAKPFGCGGEIAGGVEVHGLGVEPAGDRIGAAADRIEMFCRRRERRQGMLKRRTGEPPVAQRLAGRVLVVPVAGEDARAAHPHLADGAVAERRAIRGRDPNLRIGHRHSHRHHLAGLSSAAAGVGHR